MLLPFSRNPIQRSEDLCLSELVFELPISSDRNEGKPDESHLLEVRRGDGNELGGDEECNFLVRRCPQEKKNSIFFRRPKDRMKEGG